MEDEFYPPGAYSCPEHGGPIWKEIDIGLKTESIERVSDLEAMTNIFAPLLTMGTLRYSVSRDIRGILPTELTIENHGAESIDVRFRFDAVDEKLLGVICYTDNHKGKKKR